jgi:hypothetical protein
MRESLGVSHLHAMHCLHWLGRAATPQWTSPIIRLGRSGNPRRVFSVYLGPFFDGPFLCFSGVEDFPTKFAKGYCAAEPKQFWGYPRAKIRKWKRSPQRNAIKQTTSKHAKRSNKQQTKLQQLFGRHANAPCAFFRSFWARLLMGMRLRAFE